MQNCIFLKRHGKKTRNTPPVLQHLQHNRTKITNVIPGYNELECMVTFLSRLQTWSIHA